MKLTVREISDLGYWDEYCELTGTSVWAKNEGQISSDEEIDVPEELIRTILGLEVVTPDSGKTSKTLGKQ